MNANFATLAKAVGSFAPTLAGMLGGPLAGTAVTALEGAFDVAPGSGASAITQVLQTGAMTPEVLASVRAADQAHETTMQQMGVDLAKLNADASQATDAAIVSDVVDARKAAVGNEKIYDVGLFILGSFLIAMIAVLWGCWSLISGDMKISPDMAGMFAAVTGLVGSIVGYFASNAQTVINFLFGGSLSGRKNADSMAASVQSMGDSLGKAARTP